MKKVILIVIIGLLLLVGVSGGTFYAGYNSARGYNEADLEKAAQDVKTVSDTYIADLEKRLAEVSSPITALSDPDIDGVLADVRTALVEAEGKTEEVSASYLASITSMRDELATLKTAREEELQGYRSLKAQIETDIEDFDGIDRAGFEQALALADLAISSTQAAIESLNAQIAEIDTLIAEMEVTT